MKKLFILKLDLHDDKAKKKALKTVSTLSGIDLISMDMKESKLTVIGTVDPVNVVCKLRKYWATDIISLGPAIEPKKEEPKKEEPKKEEAEKEEEGKKEEPKKDGPEDVKKDEANKEDDKEESKNERESKEEDQEKKKEQPLQVAVPVRVPMPMSIAMPQPDPVIMDMVKAYRAYNPHLTTYYHVQSMEENPNACVIF